MRVRPVLPRPALEERVPCRLPASGGGSPTRAVICSALKTRNTPAEPRPPGTGLAPGPQRERPRWECEVGLPPGRAQPLVALPDGFAVQTSPCSRTPPDDSERWHAVTRTVFFTSHE